MGGEVGALLEAGVAVEKRLAIPARVIDSEAGRIPIWAVLYGPEEPAGDQDHTRALLKTVGTIADLHELLHEAERIGGEVELVIPQPLERQEITGLVPVTVEQARGQ